MAHLHIWRTDDAAFDHRFQSLMRKLSLDEGLRASTQAAGEPVEETVRRILADVRARGDEALIEGIERFDGCRLEPGELRVRPEEIEGAVARSPAALVDALTLAAERIRRFQESILPRVPKPTDDRGRVLSVRYRPVRSAAVYIPGSSASLASSVLMTAVPARVAGVRRIAMATPARPDGTVSDDRLLAAHLAGVHEVYRLGGAYAIGALAYGTASVPAVDFIVGPGNAYVNAAKRQVFGQVGIEMLAGPSEVVIIADASADAECAAADMLAQAEHNPGSAVLLTDRESFAEDTLRAIKAQLAGLPHPDAARRCLSEYGAVIVCRSIDECAEVADRLAPEHLQIMTGDPEAVAEKVCNAAAVFVGLYTPVAVGDYVAGPSHTLPTSRTARFASGLSANDFLRRVAVIRYDRTALEDDAQTIARLARTEGLEGHARSVEVRMLPGREAPPAR
ncbi:MAG: histidinol dehydrogenase [Candidatus Brocadiaceae bacterium]|nr:histidinol dehydrogenase [Candidatus Brocadiaceae bacterium]